MFKYCLILFFTINFITTFHNDSRFIILENTFEKYFNYFIDNEELNTKENKAFLISKNELKTGWQKSKIDTTWNKVFIKDTGTIYLPQTLEIQDGVYKKFAEGMTIKLDFEVSDLVAQNKGTNNFEGSDSFARVMLKTVNGKKNDFEKLDFDISKYTEYDINEIGNSFKTLILNQFSTLNQKTEKEAKLLSWHKPELKIINGSSCLHLEYERQLENNPVVTVNSYIFFNNDKMHTLTLSYRKSDSEQWKDDFIEILNSLKIKMS